MNKVLILTIDKETDRVKYTVIRHGINALPYLYLEKNKKMLFDTIWHTIGDNMYDGDKHHNGKCIKECINNNISLPSTSKLFNIDFLSSEYYESKNGFTPRGNMIEIFGEETWETTLDCIDEATGYACDIILFYDSESDKFLTSITLAQNLIISGYPSLSMYDKERMGMLPVGTINKYGRIDDTLTREEKDIFDVNHKINRAIMSLFITKENKKTIKEYELISRFFHGQLISISRIEYVIHESPKITNEFMEKRNKQNVRRVK